MQITQIKAISYKKTTLYRLPNKILMVCRRHFIEMIDVNDDDFLLVLRQKQRNLLKGSPR